MGNHHYHDEEDRVMTVRAEIDEARRRGKRSFLRKLPASDFTVDDIALLLDHGSVYQQRLGCHVLTEHHEREFDRMLTSPQALREQPHGKWPRDLDLNDWELRTRHRRRPCTTHCSDSCSNCNLFICVICGGCEGSLLPFCPDRLLTSDEDQRSYDHYRNGTGPFAKATTETAHAALVACRSRYCEDVGSMPPPRPGAAALYDAVHDLFKAIAGIQP